MRMSRRRRGDQRHLELQKRSRGSRVARGRRLQIELLEDRRMMAIGWTFSGSKLSIVAPTFPATPETIVLSVDTGGFVVDQGLGLRDGNNIPLPVLASSVTDIYIKTKRQADTIDLRAVNPTSFPGISTSGIHVTIEADWGDDHVFGSQFADKIYGDLGKDTICGMDGDDQIFGQAGDDNICGGMGSDYLDGGLGGDEILGDEGNDKIIGDIGGDTLDGGPGADLIDAFGGDTGFPIDTVYHDPTDVVIYNKGLFGVGKDKLNLGSSNIDCGCDVIGPPAVCLYETDFGDAPNSYGTLMTNNAASHQITAIGPRMGAFIDSEPDGQPSMDAALDDTLTRDDEDGIIFLGGTVLNAGGTKSITVDVQNLLPTETAKLDAWVDFDGNGLFDGNNRIFNSQTVVPGGNTLSFPVPYIGSRLGPTYARFRISKIGGLGPQGLTIGGEVEDYLVDIGCSCAFPIAPGVVGYQCESSAIASFAAQLTFLTSNLWNLPDTSLIDFEGLSGVFSGEAFAASHGVHFENLRGIGAQPEGGPVIESLDAYDGSYRPDGNTVVASHPNHLDPPLTIVFDEPVFAVGSFIGTGSEGTIDKVRIEAFDISNNLVASYDPSVFLNDDAANREGYWALESTLVGISKITIKNLNPVDFGNALIFDDLQWLPFEEQTTLIDRAADFDNVFSMSGDPVEVIDFDDLVGPVSPNAYLASHDVTIEGAAQLDSLTEGSGPVGTLDGYDGSYEPDGNRLLVASDGDELSFVFNTPVLSVGMFLADVPEPKFGNQGETGYTVRVFDVNGDILDVIGTSLIEYANNENHEGFVTYPNDPNDLAIPIGKVTVIRNSEQADSFKIDNVTFTRATIVTLPGDYNLDGIVNAADHSVWKAQFGTSVGVPGSGADGNGDGEVNAADYVVWRNNLGATLPGSGATSLAMAKSHGKVDPSSPRINLAAAAVAPSSADENRSEGQGRSQAVTRLVPLELGRSLRFSLSSRNAAPHARSSSPRVSAQTVDRAIELLVAEQIDRRRETRSNTFASSDLRGRGGDSDTSKEPDVCDLALQKLVRQFDL